MSAPNGPLIGPLLAHDPVAEQREKVRRTLAKIDPTMLALADACRDRFDAKLTAVAAVQDGEWRTLGKWPK